MPAILGARPHIQGAFGFTCAAMDLANNGGGSFGTCGGEDGAPSWEWGMLGEDNRTILGDTPDGVPPVDSDEPQDDAGDGEGVGISHPH